MGASTSRSCTGGRARVGPVTVDSLLARKHREHHADPRDLPLVFIPWQALVWLLPAYVVVALLAFPTVGLGADRCWCRSTRIKLGYEWTHYLVHSDYRPAVAVATARCGATTGCTTTRTSTTGSP